MKNLLINAVIFIAAISAGLLISPIFMSVPQGIAILENLLITINFGETFRVIIINSLQLTLAFLALVFAYKIAKSYGKFSEHKNIPSREEIMSLLGRYFLNTFALVFLLVTFTALIRDIVYFIL